MVKENNLFLMSIPMLRFFAIIAFYVILQIVILLQRPFIQYDFIFTYYSCVVFLSGLFFIKSVLKSKNNLIFSFLEILTILVLYKSQPLFSSFYLVMILILLFLSGLESDLTENIILVFATSILVSVCNILFFKWQGLQNILNLGLFNLVFLAVIFFSVQLKAEFFQLSQSLSLTTLKLKSKAELAQLLIENMPLGLMALNSKNEVVFSNSIIDQNLKLNAKSILELTLLKAGSHTPEIAYYNSEIADKRFYQIESATYFDADYQQNINLHLIKDTTDMHLLQDQMKHKEKMAAVGQLAAGIAHEIRNPLAGISGSIELLSQDTKNPDDQKLMKIILREIDRLNNLITDFLDYSKPEKRPDQKVDVALILDEVIQNIKLSANTPKNLVYQVQLQSCSVLGYSDQLKQAFLNIIVNAVQAMKDKTEPILTVRTVVDSEKVCVEISDTGLGMTAESKKRIFEPFYTTKSKGTGLGLAITHKVFESHGASVEIESELNMGTKFKIIFNKINT